MRVLYIEVGGFEVLLDDSRAWLTRSKRQEWMRRWKSFLKGSSGDVKGTIPEAVRYHFVSNDVRRHRLISINSISLLPCHGTARWYGRVREGVGGNRKESDNR